MAGMTMTQKILAAHAGRESVAPGDSITITVDVALANDITAPPAILQIEELDVPLHDPGNVVFVCDHFVPNKDIPSAENCRLMREFAAKNPGVHFYEPGTGGIEHALLPEKGLAVPGSVIIGADSHTCTYGGLGAFATGVGSTDLTGVLALGETWLTVPETVGVRLTGTLRPWVSGKDVILNCIGKIGADGGLGKTIEFFGPGLDQIDLDGRLTIANMGVEAGAVNCIMPPDKAIIDYVRARTDRPFTPVYSDKDAVYERLVEIDLAHVEPQVAAPFSPANVLGVSCVGHISVDQVAIGSCTNGRIADLRAAAAVLRGRSVAPGVRLLVTPATPEVFKQALKEGLVEIFAEAGAVMLPPSCGVCFGGHLGVIGKGEVCLSTSNRNFKGRMGHEEGLIYLSSPAVAAASAVRGHICGPEALSG